MTLEDFYDNLGIVYKEYMSALEAAQNEFRSGVESLMEDASKAFDVKYSGAIKAMLDEKTKELIEFSDKFDNGE